MKMNCFTQLLQVLLLLHFNLSFIHAHYLKNYKINENCDHWAEIDQECINNPRFMWGDCLGSCLQFAQDDHENCERWAAEGECTENPNYIHLHCPKSCALAIAWNPWVRRQFEIADVIHPDPTIGNDGLESASNVYAASVIVADRLEKFLGGLHASVIGLTSTAPSEYLGMVGLAEGFLYVLRLQEVLFHSLNSPAEIKSAHIAKIHHILQVLRAGYSSDKILLQLPSWLRFIQESNQIALTEIERRLASPLHKDQNDFKQIVGRYSNLPELSLSSIIQYTLGENYVEEASENSYLPENTRTVSLSNQQVIPLIGLGTWQLEGKQCEETVYTAIKLGYRLIDTAEAYGNEREVGNAITRAIKEGIVKREELFLATKVSDPRNAGFTSVQGLVNRQLTALQTNYIDLYMLHSPLENEKLQNDTWLGLETLLKKGVIRSLGLSNFGSRELTDLLKTVQTTSPVILQNKLDIYHVGKQIDIRGDTILAYAKEKGVTLMAYSPFSAYPFVMEPIDDPIINFIAKKYSFSLQKKVTPAQIILKWIIQRGMTVIPRSTSETRLKENLEAYDLPNLSKEYMTLIDTIQFLISSPVSVPILPV